MQRTKSTKSISKQHTGIKIFASVWLLVNVITLLGLQQNFKQAYYLKERALETTTSTRMLAQNIIGNSTNELDYNRIVTKLKTFAKGGILPDENSVISALPEELVLRAESLLESLDYLKNQPTELNQSVVDTNCTLLNAGFAQQAAQAENMCLWGIGGLVAVNALFLLIGFRKGHNSLVARMLEIRSGLNNADTQAIKARQPDEIDEISIQINNIKQEIGLATTVVRQTGEGKVTEIDISERHPLTLPLFDALKGMQQKMEEVAKADNQRNWTSHGLARFVEILRSKDDDLEGLTHVIISELVKYTESNQGAIYLAEGEGSKMVLRQQACYAFGRRKWLEKEILPGDGMVGQAFLEKDTVYLTDVPKAYINITSGLGDAPPTSVLIVPLLINEEVMGVVEIASFKYFEDFEIQFVEKLGENIAATLASVKNAQQTKRLLEESQLMAENLRAQEEEVRQNMEELTATQEEMMRKEIELNGHLSAINNTLATVEFSLEGKVLSANENFLQVTRYRLDEIKQHHHRIFCNPDFVQTNEYENFWKSLAQGRTQQGEYQRVNKHGELVWLRASYTPVLDNQGRPVKIITCAFDITEEKQRELEMQGQYAAVNNTLATVEFTMEGVVINANETFCKVVGYELDEIQYNHHAMFCESAYTQGENYQQFWKAINRGETQSGEFLRFNKEGKEIWLKATYTPVLDSDGKPVKVIKFAFDITKEKHRDLDRRAQLEAINISNLKLELTPDGAIIEANPIIMDLLKQEPDMVIGNSFGNLLADDEAMQTQFIADWAKLDRKECFTGTYALKNSTGETVWVAANYSPVVATNGEITKIIIVGQDITERKKLEENLAIQIEQMRAQEEFLQDTMDQLQAQEEELRQNMEEMQAIQEEMESKMAQSDEMAIEMKGRISALDETVTLCELDEQGNISYVNNKFCDVLGYKPDDIVGKFFSQLYHQEVPQSMTKHIWSSVKKGKTFKGRYPYVTKKGVTCWMDTTIVPVMDSQKKAPFKYTIVAFPVEQEDEQTILLQKELEAIKLS